jgi:glycosyltransferase involved in cell wall biosynthesis
MKIGIYSPYFHILGGGERYLSTIAEYLSRDTEVTIFAESSIKEKAKSVFNITLDRVHFLPKEKFRANKLFDILFYMTNGSLFFSLSRKNFLIIQSPSHIPSSKLVNRIKLLNWRIICYSQFMYEIIKKRLNISSIILPPAIDTVHFKHAASKKKNIILSVGRFFSHLHNKKHDFLIEVFKNNYRKTFKDWELIIAGGMVDKDGERLMIKLKKQSDDYPIEILANIPFDKLKSLYQDAKIYWHAAGFGEDLVKYPERAEHFGITTLEAMSAGCVPVVFEAGGQKDIVIDGVNGYFWQKEEELVQKSMRIISDRKLFDHLSLSAQKRSDDFSLTSFYEKLNKLISE